MDKWTHCTKMASADSSAENTPNAPEFICPSTNVLDFNEKKGFILRPCSVPLEKDVANNKFLILLQILEQQLNETRVRKQMEISEIDGQLTEKYEAKMQQSLAVSITF